MAVEKVGQIVEPYGERGKDFVEIWHAPEAPDERVVMNDTLQTANFHHGLLVIKTPEGNAAMEKAASMPGVSYIKSDPEITKPFICQHESCHGSLWYSQKAFELHTKFKHASASFRK